MLTLCRSYCSGAARRVHHLHDPACGLPRLALVSAVANSIPLTDALVLDTHTHKQVALPARRGSRHELVRDFLCAAGALVPGHRNLLQLVRTSGSVVVALSLVADDSGTCWRSCRGRVFWRSSVTSPSLCWSTSFTGERDYVFVAALRFRSRCCGCASVAQVLAQRWQQDGLVHAACQAPAQGARLATGSPVFCCLLKPAS